MNNILPGLKGSKNSTRIVSFANILDGDSKINIFENDDRY